MNYNSREQMTIFLISQKQAVEHICAPKSTRMFVICLYWPDAETES